MNRENQEGPDIGAFLVASLLHFYSGQPLQNLSGVDSNQVQYLSTYCASSRTHQSGLGVSIGVCIDQHRPSPVEARWRSRIVLSRLCGYD